MNDEDRRNQLRNAIRYGKPSSTFRSTNPIQTPARKFRIKWDEVAAFAAVCTVSVGVTLAVVTVALEASEARSNAVTPACATEYDTNCFWDADKQGNGIGNSFYTGAEGKTYYLPATECTDNLKAWTRDASQMIEDMDSRWASSAPYSASVRADNIDPMTSRLDYVLNEVCN